MNTLCQDQSPGDAVSSLPKPQSDPTGLADSQSTSNPPPELERGTPAVVVDEDGLILVAEPICAPLFQWEPAQLVGKPLEVLLLAGADRIRQQLVPDQGPPDSDSKAPSQLFALARRRDGTSFAATVTLQLQARCWWAVAFHNVNLPPVGQGDIRPVGLPPPASTPRRRRARVAAPLALEIESIPDIFQQAAADPALQPEPPATAPAVAPEPPALASQVPLSQDELAPAAPPAQPAPANSDARLHDLEQRPAQSAEDLKSAQAQRPQQPAPSPSPRDDEPAQQDQLHELEGRFRTTVSSLARTTAELETERGERRRSEQRASTLADQMQQLHEELKNHLAAGQLDHQRVTELERRLHEQEQQNNLTVAKLQSALELEQCERQRLDAELLRSRADSACAGRTQVTGLRRQLQPPAENLHRTACRLLQLQLPDDQKELLQTMLEDILLIQTSLQESPES